MSKNNQSQELYPVALTIAGSDSGGGAGIQADLRTFNAFGVFGCTAITAVTAQNPGEVRRVDALPPESVTVQMEAVLDRISVCWAKTGMLANAGIVEAVAKVARKRQLPLVVDPVMVSTSGVRLLEEEAIEAVIRKLIPVASWITPNIPEAELLLGRSLKSREDFMSAAKECFDRWGVSVLLKTGHAPGARSVTDFVCRNGELYSLTSPRVPEQGASHGTGCTLSAAIAAGLALDMPWKQALCEAKGFVYGSLRETVAIGDGLVAMYPPVEDSIEAVRLEKIRA